MLRNLNKRRGGFTLVEIMIVVAIIALLATIAIPNFLRSRKRSQASEILQDLRLIEQAKDQYAIDNNKRGNVNVRWEDVAPYIKKTSKLYLRNGTDLFGGVYTPGIVDGTTYFATTTGTEFTDLGLTSQFWGAFTSAAAPAAQ